MDNRQVQTGPVNTDVTLEATDVEAFDVTTDAAGNVYDAGAQGVSLELDSSQTVSNDVTNFSAALITGSAAYGAVTTTAHGNAGSALVSEGNLRGRIEQTVDSFGTVIADSRLVQDGGGAIGDAGVTTTAVANNQYVGVTGGWNESDTVQRSNASVVADGSALVERIDGSLALVSAAVGNNLEAATDRGSTYVGATQSQTGESVLGASFVTAPYAQEVTAVATASGNNLVASNAYGPLTMDVRQDADSYVRAQTGVNVGEYGAVTATAAGVGNAIVASTLGAETTFTSSQVSSGGVDALVDFTGGGGYDSVVQATAHGNSLSVAAWGDGATGFDATSSQVNSDEVRAVANSTVSGRSRSAIVSAGAVGNSASYYVQGNGR